MLPSALKIFVKQIQKKIWNTVPYEISTITNFTKIKEKISEFSSFNTLQEIRMQHQLYLIQIMFSVGKLN